ncbi:ATP-binding protein [Spirosoma foliorum]|uniref:ATP-binding protein n=1 Tax=Spirosoma foliorum TaxID=2710596 RepID=A0A7G5GUT4_9BACT|nr:ATP-binding protein [Spirosoma foliorum]QMW02626.1 ATP-binding protein [Spirosoma foliorum]
MEENFRILTVAPNLIQIEVLDADLFKKEQDNFTIGSYLKISDESNVSIIALVQSYKIKDSNSANLSTEVINNPTFILDAQPIGFLDDAGNFKRGGQQIAIPPNSVEIASIEVLKKIYNGVSEDKRFIFSTLAQNGSLDISVDGDKFFSKHIAIVGSTGSGKSGTVAKILQQGIEPSNIQATNGILNNAHIILFDLHGEYAPAFPKSKKLDVNSLMLPYWLMNSEELEEMFIESNDNNSHNQISQFKHAVTLNKKKYNPNLNKVNYDSSVYFSISEVYKYLCNQNIATKFASTGELAVEEKVQDTPEEYQLFGDIKFKDKKPSIINSGPYAGEFDRFVPRLETKLNDDRLSFLLKPEKADASKFKTEDLSQIIKQFIGYSDEDRSNITIIDLSGIPFEVLSLVVSLISRIVFDFCFYYKSLKQNGQEAPFLLVLEEAHNYIPQSKGVKYSAVKKSIERIAKEGRKYGLSLMIVSQRPSEISETIFSQCSNFVAMRLTNPTDQQYVKRLLPDSISTITDSLPTLERQEALLIGDSIPIPTIVRIKELEEKPASDDIEFRTEWRKDWMAIYFDTLINKVTKAV